MLREIILLSLGCKKRSKSFVKMLIHLSKMHVIVKPLKVTLPIQVVGRLHHEFDGDR